jgi:menaquinone-dependent protoporphyrinogen IX oxidase
LFTISQVDVFDFFDNFILKCIIKKEGRKRRRERDRNNQEWRKEK